MSIKTKRIKVLSSCPIRVKGWAYGPIVVPYHETVQNIFDMLRQGLKVVEVLSNGDEVVLDSINFDKDNSPVVKPVKLNVTQPVKEHVVVEQTVDTVEVIEEVKPVITEQTALDVTPVVEIADEPVVINNGQNERRHKHDKKNK